MGILWLLPTAVFGALVVVAAVLVRRLIAEMRATTAALESITEAVAAVRSDLVRTREVIDSLDLPSMRKAAGERALSLVIRWAARRVLPL